MLVIVFLSSFIFVYTNLSILSSSIITSDSFTPNLSYVSIPLHHSGSPPHHPLNPTPDYPKTPFKPLQHQSEISHVQM